jgi:hypothetical protein
VAQAGRSLGACTRQGEEATELIEHWGDCKVVEEARCDGVLQWQMTAVVTGDRGVSLKLGGE